MTYRKYMEDASTMLLMHGLPLNVRKLLIQEIDLDVAFFNYEVNRIEAEAKTISFEQNKNLT